MSKQLVHDDPKFFNQKLNVPIDGVIQLGPKGEVTVSDEAAKILLTIPKWFDPAAVKKTVETAPKAKKESKLVLEEEPVNSGLGDFDLENLDKLELGELQEVAVAAQIEVPPVLKNNKKGLTTFLKKRLKEKLGQ